MLYIAQRGPVSRSLADIKSIINISYSKCNAARCGLRTHHRAYLIQGNAVLGSTGLCIFLSCLWIMFVESQVSYPTRDFQQSTGSVGANGLKCPRGVVRIARHFSHSPLPISLIFHLSSSYICSQVPKIILFRLLCYKQKGLAATSTDLHRTWTP